ncbi:tetratricopeptide repeat protein [bacterium]|nr:tetratricopeptide repeat protein [bacterium]
MKKSVILLLIILAGAFTPAYAGSEEVIEDYMDMASHNALIGDYEDAVKYLDKIIRLTPQNADSTLSLKSLLYQLGTKNQKSFITGYLPELDKSMTARLAGDRITEGNILQDATKGGNFWVYHYLGEFFRENKEYSAAIECYFRAYQMEPSFTQALLAMAICYLETGQYEMVNEPIKRFIYYNQQSDVAYAIRAKAYLNMNQYSDAETEIVTAMALNNDIEYQLIHGIILYRRGHYAKAINVLNDVAKEVQTSDVFKYLGLCYLAKKEYSNAMLNLDKAILLSDDDKELNEKYNETRALIKSINTEKLQNEERKEVTDIYTKEGTQTQSEAKPNEQEQTKKNKKRDKSEK